ncbi:MAG: endonuclease MutS2 [Candidatus Izimaplasma sp.]|nr:endonuclease MutS2 [Candidatus Izimaplasma bacterium]
MSFDSFLLEFDKVKLMIVNYAQTSLGKFLVKEIEPTNNSLVIKRKLSESAHALKIITLYQEPPFGGITNLTDTLKKAHIESVLRPTEFLDIIALLDASLANVRFYKQVKELEILETALDDYFENIEIIPKLKTAILLVINDNGEVNDSASPLLHKIRNAINVKQKRIQDRLNTILQKDKSKLTEILITIRNNHFVVPVKTSEKNNFKGSIIDYSSSGETVYMEPHTVSSINNEISILILDEKKEVERILRELTLQVGLSYYQLINNLKILSELDAIFATARFALEYTCSMPLITEKEINLIKARHPLINQEEVVANTITFNKNEKVIIITGPNTGGKTVALKTMGLLSIMVQSGLLIPVDKGSKTVIFDNIFADIGDEQSIEQSLSTFSSHMTRIIKIIDNLTVDSLILLDELGSGTDPKEGASLAISILDYLLVRGVYIIATTHYPELKAYAYNKNEIVNASVEFDVDTLSPTYRLLLGTPGKSNALLISERLGLNSEIISQAKKHVLTSQSEVTDLINKLEKRGNTLEQQIREYETLIKDNKELVNRTNILQKELIEEKRRLKGKIAIEKSQIVLEVKEEALNLIKDLEDLKNKENIKDHEIAEMKYIVRTFDDKIEKEKHAEKHDYLIGDTVNILKFNRYGELLKKQKNKQWLIKMGTLNSVFKEDQFEFVKRTIKKPNKINKISSNIKKNIKTELDLRGMRYEEAEYALDKYIDDCLVVNIPFASIIHGYGTLTLRKLVKTYLKNNKHVLSYRDGEGGEGGSGVTVVYFK